MKKIILVLFILLLPLASQAKQISSKNKFGFLSAGLDKSNFSYLSYTNAGWLRPHLGEAIWGLIENSEGTEYDWSGMDSLVSKSQKHGLNLLVTIWPFASWDQKERANYEECLVSDNDQFLKPQRNKKSKDETYLPKGRCNPNSWDRYTLWVEALVERYDGDGVSDYTELKYPIKYWEVMNEPDLGGAEDLDFYKQGSNAYYKLLKETYQAVKSSDETAKVLIAGAAGGDESQLGFYEEMFTDHLGTENYFDVGNIHCISNDNETEDFNVGVYKNMLESFGMDKPIWVTEAQAIFSDSQSENYSALRKRVKNALNLGVKKIFFTQYSFESLNGSQTDAGLEYAKKKYSIIVDLYKN